MVRVSRRKFVASGAGVLMIGGVLGCGSEGPPSVTSSDAKATVTGTVKVDGKPLSRGTITFDPANVARKMAPTATAKIESGGKYKIETLVGPNTIQVSSPDLTRGGGGQFDVKEGSNEFNLDLHLTR